MNHPKLEYLKRFVKQNDPKEEYKVLSCIGSGTYGDVFKAIHRETREPVAVKIMKIDLKDDIRSICQEIHTLRECRHPNIVQFFGSYLRNNKLWICMEYCGGQSMQDIYLYTRRPLEEDCIAFVSRETLQGLNFMHERGRIHRDIKGANILLTDDGRVKVADFGVAAQLNNTVGKRTTLIGTPYWMAPEVASIDSRGAGYDGKCDVWGVGITAIEYAELQPPMFDLDPRKALQILGTRSYRPPTLQDKNKWSRHFHSFIKCCLVKQERNRPDAATMLTHVFVTNPSLSKLLTQRLLNYKHQLELRVNQPTSMRSHSPEPPSTRVADTKQPAVLNVPAAQNGADGAPSSDTVTSFDRSSRSVAVSAVTCGAAPVENARAMPLQEQFVSTRHMLAANNDARLLSTVQAQDSPSIAEYPAISAASDSTSSQILSADSQIVISVDPSKIPAPANGVTGRDRGPQLLPVLPPKHQHLLASDSPDAKRDVAPQKPRRPAPPASALRSHLNRDAPTTVGAADLFSSGENWFNGRLLQSSSEDLLREVMDAFERRRSSIDPPDSGDPLRPSPDISTTDGKCAVLIDHRKRLPVIHPGNISANTPPAIRTRSKRRAPPPPTSATGGATATTTEESSSAVPNSCLYQTIDDSPRLPVLARQGTDSSGCYGNGDAGLLVRYERSQEPAEGVEQTRLSTYVPPRPPPPRLGPDDPKHSDHRSTLFDTNFGLPPTPKVLMGACFLLLFEGCPLKINATATWVHPETQSQIILFGTNDGIYFLNLIDLADGTLELLVRRRCLWLSVLKDTMMSVCGQKPQLYSHNLISLIKSKGHSPPKFLQKRFQPTTKVPNTRGCHIANVVRNPYNGMKYLCGAIDKTIVVMEWYNPRSTFIEVKRVDVPSMPCPVLNFDLIIYQDQPLPLVCLGVFATPDPKVYKLHIVNLNEDTPSSTFYTDQMKPEDQLQVIKVVQLEYNTLLICFPTHATIVNLNGRVNEDREGWKTHLEFGTTVHSVVCLQDSVLAFHTHGLRGVGFDGQMTQDINDDKHVYRLLGCDKNVVVESRPSDDPMSNSNIYLLAGHKELY